MKCFTALNQSACPAGNSLNCFVDDRDELSFNSDSNVHLHMNSRKYSRSTDSSALCQQRLFSGAQ